MTKQQEELLLDWASVAIKELGKPEEDRTARILREGGKALLEEIKDGDTIAKIDKVEQKIIKDALENIIYPDGCPEGEIAEDIIRRIENQS